MGFGTQSVDTLTKSKPLYVIDGKIADKQQMLKMPASEIEEINVLEDESATTYYGDMGKNGAVLVVTKNGTKTAEFQKILDEQRNKQAETAEHYKNALIIVDGVVQSEKGMNAINNMLTNNKFGNKAWSQVLLKGTAATDKYGEKGRDGVIEITTKPTAVSGKDLQDQPVVEVNKLLQGKVTGLSSQKTAQSNEEPVYRFVKLEHPPTYPGGMDKFYKYIGDNLKYPKEAQDNNITGKVFISFVIEKDGSVTNAKVSRKLGYGTDEEALRIVKASKKWIPGKQNGKPVRVEYAIPIGFTLQK